MFGLLAAQPRDELAVAQNHFSIGCAREDTRSRFRVLFRYREIGPAEDRAIGVGRIRRGHLHKFRLFIRRRGAQLAEQVDRGGQGELRGAEAGHEVAAADAAALFEGFQHVVDCAENPPGMFSAATCSRIRTP